MSEKTLTITVDEDSEGLRIDSYLSGIEEVLSRNYVSRLISEGGAELNGEKVKKCSVRVSEGDRVSLTIPESRIPDILPEDIKLDILYEDSDVLVVNKPKGMVVHPSNGHYSGTMVNALLYHCRDLSGINGVLRPGIVHRIDKDTTGSVIICKNDTAHKDIAEQLKEHSIKRLYRAVVLGNITGDGSIDKPIGRSKNDRKKMAVTEDGKRAVTHYHVLENFGDYSYIECRLETGRTHQIRVHMASMGHPLLGDTVYGSGKSPFKTEGQVLHAYVLGFRQPTSREYIETTAPIPEDFQRIINSLENRVK
ncbi:MAG: RluA family pseudouridine synthase [Lachnospiraceae bacterium]|nr:RluA family pseudouridine synthase [Lachnospiraceae bacterium]